MEDVAKCFMDMMLKWEQERVSFKGMKHREKEKERGDLGGERVKYVVEPVKNAYTVILGCMCILWLGQGSRHTNPSEESCLSLGIFQDRCDKSKNFTE